MRIARCKSLGPIRVLGLIMTSPPHHSTMALNSSKRNSKEIHSSAANRQNVRERKKLAHLARYPDKNQDSKSGIDPAKVQHSDGNSVVHNGPSLLRCLL